jgi:hypothetical protein
LKSERLYRGGYVMFGFKWTRGKHTPPSHALPQLRKG